MRTGLGLGFQRGGGVSFNPATLPGLYAWYNARNAASITNGVGTKVAQIADLSGNSRDAAQSSGPQQPEDDGVINGNTALDFTASSSAVLSFPDDTEMVDVTALFIADVPAGAAYGLFAKQSSWALQTNFAGYLQGRFTGLTESPVSAVLAAGVGLYVYRTRLAASNAVDFWKDSTKNTQAGLTASTLGPNNVNDYCLGAIATGGNNSLNGAIGEAIICSGALSNADLNSAANYLVSQWGVGSWSNE